MANNSLSPEQPFPTHPPHHPQKEKKTRGQNEVFAAEACDLSLPPSASSLSPSLASV